jgi:release factor glutamine methyltransferase
VRSIKNALDFGAAQLKNVCDRPRYEAQILLCHATKLSRVDLVVKEQTQVDTTRFESMIARRAKGEPIEYITGLASFYSREFICEKGALIPRPETEALIDRAIDLTKDFDAPIIAEIGAGSGAVAVTLAMLSPNIRVIASDISGAAIRVARKNIERFQVADRVKLIQTNLLDGVDDDFDALISNPPYVRADYPLPKPASFEPKAALIGGKKGTEILEAIIALRKPVLACECGYDQETTLREALKKNGYKMVEFYKDYAGLTRGFTAKQ